MSRIGKHPVAVPKGVTAEVKGNTVHVKGPKGELERTLHPEMKVTLTDASPTLPETSKETVTCALTGR